MKKYYTIREFERIFRNEELKEPDDSKGYIELPANIFDEIEQYVITNKRNQDFDDAVEFLQLGYEKKRKYLKAKNYVGIIQTKSGVTIEILPKIYLPNENSDSNAEIIKTRKIFLKMLNTLKDSPFKKLNLSSMKSGKFPLFEIFIRMFIEELFQLVHRGLKSGYVSQQENENFLKGKLLLKENIKFNFVHKERFYVEYDEFLQNRPENRLLKTTVAFLLKKSKLYENQSKLRQLLYVFDEIPCSTNIISDFNNLKINRLMKDYDILLKWCNIFLNNQSFTNFVGDSVAFALLFPMEKVFESYVASQIKSMNSDWWVHAQDQEHYLVQEPKKFRLKPDIVMRKEEKIIILDTKWKNLKNDKTNFGISQADMYQMYAYGMKYTQNEKQANEMYLIYPYNENFKNIENKSKENGSWDSGLCTNIKTYKYHDNLSINILLWNFEEQLLNKPPTS